jgi:hypothetical protein
MASAWLIRRFVDPEADFAFVPRDAEATAVTEGTPFHLPGAEFAHRDGLCTFEAILERNWLDRDRALVELGRIVRAADSLHSAVAFRRQPVQEALPPNAPPETAGRQAVLHGVRLLADDDQTAIERASATLDAVYAAFQKRSRG